MALLRSEIGYEQCVRQSEQVSWSLDEESRDIAYDFDRNFLPDTLVCTVGLQFLNARELRIYNHLLSHGYAHIFQFVEEFIIRQVIQQSTRHLHRNPVAMRALLRFCDEEIKHQSLFESFKQAFSVRYGMPLRVIRNEVEVAKNICSFSPVAVMLLISMLEWMTQRHYLVCFRNRPEGLDKGFSRLFYLHWVEEAQHARLDSLELSHMTAGMSRQEIDTEIDLLLDLCEQLAIQLLRQSELDVLNMGDATGRGFSAGEKESLCSAIFASYQNAFIGMGLTHPIFLQQISELAPGRESDLLDQGRGYTMLGSETGDDTRFKRN